LRGDGRCCRPVRLRRRLHRVGLDRGGAHVQARCKLTDVPSGEIGREGVGAVELLPLPPRPVRIGRAGSTRLIDAAWAARIATSTTTTVQARAATPIRANRRPLVDPLDRRFGAGRPGRRRFRGQWSAPSRTLRRSMPVTERESVRPGRSIDGGRPLRREGRPSRWLAPPREGNRRIHVIRSGTDPVNPDLQTRSCPVSPLFEQTATVDRPSKGTNQR